MLRIFATRALDANIGIQLIQVCVLRYSIQFHCFGNAGAGKIWDARVSVPGGGGCYATLADAPCPVIRSL